MRSAGLLKKADRRLLRLNFHLLVAMADYDLELYESTFKQLQEHAQIYDNLLNKWAGKKQKITEKAIIDIKKRQKKFNDLQHILEVQRRIIYENIPAEADYQEILDVYKKVCLKDADESLVSKFNKFLERVDDKNQRKKCLGRSINIKFLDDYVKIIGYKKALLEKQLIIGEVKEELEDLEEKQDTNKIYA